MAACCQRRRALILLLIHPCSVWRRNYLTRWPNAAMNHAHCGSRLPTLVSLPSGCISRWQVVAPMPWKPAWMLDFSAASIAVVNHKVYSAPLLPWGRARIAHRFLREFGLKAHYQNLILMSGERWLVTMMGSRMARSLLLQPRPPPRVLKMRGSLLVLM